MGESHHMLDMCKTRKVVGLGNVPHLLTMFKTLKTLLFVLLVF